VSSLFWRDQASQHRCVEGGLTTGCGLVQSVEARMRYRTYTRTLASADVYHHGRSGYLRGNRDVAAVDDLRPGVERVRFERDVVSATKSNPT
jgi:hypothetical protein